MTWLMWLIVILYLIGALVAWRIIYCRATDNDWPDEPEFLATVCFMIWPMMLVGWLVWMFFKTAMMKPTPRQKRIEAARRYEQKMLELRANLTDADKAFIERVTKTSDETFI